MPTVINANFSKLTFDKKRYSLYSYPETLGIRTFDEMKDIRTILVKNSKTGNIIRFTRKRGSNIIEDGLKYIMFSIDKANPKNETFNKLWGNMLDLNIKVLQYFKRDAAALAKKTKIKQAVPKPKWSK